MTALRRHTALALALAGGCAPRPTAPTPVSPSSPASQREETPPPPLRTHCDPRPVAEPWPTIDGGRRSIFLRSARVLHLRVVASTPGADWGQARCVSLELEIVERFRGGGPERAGDRVPIVVQQSMITSYTSRPAGAWSIVEQTLEPGSELVAFCPTAAAAAEQLRESCQLVPADAAGDLRLVRDAEGLDLPALLERASAHASELSWVFAGVLWDLHRDEAARDAAVFDAIVGLLERPQLSRLGRGALLNEVYGALGMEIPETSAHHFNRMALALFRLLALPEAEDLHDNIVAPYLPNLLGLTGGMQRRTAAEVFGRDRDARARAVAALAKHRGLSSTTALSMWIAGR